MLAKVPSASIIGIEGFLVEVEVDISRGLPEFTVVGLPDPAVKESRERVRSAIKNSQFEFQPQKIIVNLAPADVKKEGPAFDLPIAIGILTATEQVRVSSFEGTAVLGELSLNGDVRGITGVLPITISAKNCGIKRLIIPAVNAEEAALVSGIEIIPVSHLREAADYFNKIADIAAFTADINAYFNKPYAGENFDFSDVKGHENIKRAVEVAVAGHHNIMMIGPPGSGKTMIARRIPTIMPPLTLEEALEVTKIYSCSGLLPEKQPLLTHRPFRAPHHTVSAASMVGGGRIPKPGEISLAHYGVLFLDEMPEFHRDVLEVLRQPLEDGIVTVSRVQATITFPAKFMLVCSMNPCPCGFLWDNSHRCNCTRYQIERYFSKISGPLLDRIDIQVEVPALEYKELAGSGGSRSSEEMLHQVQKAQAVQLERYKGSGIFFNSQLNTRMINKYCRLKDRENRLLKAAFEKMRLSARAYARILKVARTIADMDGSDEIREEHLAEAIQYRSLDRKLM